MYSSTCIIDHAPNIFVSVVYEFHGEPLLVIVRVPWFAMLLSGKLKEAGHMAG